MRVDEICTQDVRDCRPEQSLADAARMLWETDCGSLPVVDDQRRVVGVITDRDICMATCVRSVRASNVRVREAMTQPAITCRAEDTIEDAMSTMAVHRIRRLPVVGTAGRLAGVLSVHDILSRLGEDRAAAVVRMMQAIGGPGRTIRMLGGAAPSRRGGTSEESGCQNGVPFDSAGLS